MAKLVILFTALLLTQCNSPDSTKPCSLEDKSNIPLYLFYRANGIGFCNIRNSLNSASNSSATSPELTFTGFSFTDSANGLSKTYTGTITGTNIAIEIPYGKLTTAIPSLSTNATLVQAGTTTVTSGVTPVDFTNPVSFTLTGPNGSKQVYTVTAYAITPVEDTGVTTCTDNSAFQTCSTVAATFPRQDGHLINVPNAKGVQTPSTNSGYPSDFITKNTLTGIVWKTCLEGKTGFDCSGGSISNLNYTNAITACSNLNTANSGAGYAGIKNWRLPTIQELMQGQVFATYQINWDVTYFPTPVTTERYPALRSSNLILPAATSSMIANGAGGNDGMPSVLANGTTTNVRCVSGSPFPSADLIDNNDGTIFDKRSSLYWQKCAINQTNDSTCSSVTTGRTWQGVLQDCNNLTILGKQWRMPNVIEFTSLIDTTQTVAPFINTSKFIGHPPASGNAKHFNISNSNLNNVAYSARINFAVPSASPNGLDTKANTTNGGNDYLGRCVASP